MNILVLRLAVATIRHDPLETGVVLTEPESQRVLLGVASGLEEPEEEMLLVTNVEVAGVLDGIRVAEGGLLLVETEPVLWELRVSDVEDCRWTSARRSCGCGSGVAWRGGVVSFLSASQSHSQSRTPRIVDVLLDPVCALLGHVACIQLDAIEEIMRERQLRLPK